ncbi:MAG TPA: DUF5683 domain-containing protein [Puia sp.]|jgi:hypothetical protein|nr:DUF5683 domain-containing protein [Puia sp.]
MKTVRYLTAVFLLLSLHQLCLCQQKNDTVPSFIKGKQGTGTQVTDSLPPRSKIARTRRDSPYKVDSATRQKHDPRKATLYSTFFPGMGQFYNRKYWKIPIVWGAVGISAYLYFDNKSWYQKCQYALAVTLGAQATGSLNVDSFNKVDPKLKNLVSENQDLAIRQYRNEYRKDQDYAILFFLLFWGLNIVDATVDAHLINFDISDKLTIHLREGNSSPPPIGMPSATVSGIGLAFDWHKPRFKTITLP